MSVFSETRVIPEAVEETFKKLKEAFSSI